MIKFVKKSLDGPLTGVEIGVAKGFNAKTILLTLPIDTLYLIDPYTPYAVTSKTGKTKYVDWHVNDYEKAKQRLSKWQSNIQFIKQPSNLGILELPDNLDLGYIDGNHSGERVRQDIELLYPKIKAGGILGGHDYGEHLNTEVTGVVNKFAKNKKLYHEEDDWWVIKE